MTTIKNSKKGFSLPVAIAVTSVLILLSASLIFIATNSISNTSEDVSSRQAYLNVKSALDYAKAYYTGITDFASIGTDDTAPGVPTGSRIEYMAMADSGGTTNEGASVAASSAITTSAQTYVVAQYRPAEGANPATIKLTAYANYADAFGNKGKTAHLSVTYNIDNSGGSVGRITIPTGKPQDPGDSGDNGITLNIKKYPGMDWALATYIWTYKDVQHVYTGKAHYESYGVASTASQINANELNANESNPGGKWINGFSTGDTRNGPSTSAVAEGGDWFSNTFYTNDEDVHYFNVIISRRGGMLSAGTDDVQSCEMFHLWYLDKRDKNIYFEIKKPHIYYYTSTHWDGKKNIETWPDASGNWIDDPTILVYVTNPKTTVHVNFVNGDESSSETSLTSAPVVNDVLESGAPLSGQSYIHSGNKYTSGIPMAYEGCGWWVANIESSGNFTMNIPYNGASRDVKVPTYTDKEAWIIYDNASGTLNCYSSEAAACEAAGISKTSYVTVHAKGFTTNNTIEASLSYGSVGIQTSDERIALINKINEANKIKSDDFEDASYQVLKDAIAEGTAIYNDVNYIQNAPGPKNSQKVEQAANGYTKGGVTYIGYKKATKNIQEAIEKLKPKTIDSEQYTQLNTLISTGDSMVKSAGVYDYGKLTVFSSGPLASAKAVIADSSSTASDATEAIDNLTTAIDELELTGKLDKTVLQSLIDESMPYISDTNYDAGARATFKTAHDAAQVLIKKANLYQTEIDDEVTSLTAEFSILKSTYRTPLDMSALDAIMSSSLAFINSSPTENFTTEGFNKLVETYNSAQTIKAGASTTQEDIDKITADLNQAYFECIIQKPANSDDTLVADGKMKIYVSTPVSFDLYLLKSGTDTEAKLLFSSFALDTSNNLYSCTIDRAAYDTVQFAVTVGGAEVRSGTVPLASYTDGNFVASLSLNEGTLNVVLGKLTTLYFEKSKFDTAPEVQINGAAVAVVSEDTNHYAVRFIYDDGISIAVNYDGETVSEFTAKAGQWVVIPGSNDPVSVSLIHPIYETSTSASAPKATTASLTSAGSTNVQLLAYDDTGVTTESVPFTLPEGITVEEDECVIILDMSYSVNRDKYMSADIAPYVYAYQQVDHGSGPIKISVTASEPGTPMNLVPSTTCYYYAIIPNKFTGFNINCVTNASAPETGTIKFTALGAYSSGDINIMGKTAKYFQVLWKTSTGNYKDGSYQLETTDTTPMLAVPRIEADDIVGTDLQMPFVGGKRVRIVNRSYKADYSGITDSNGTGLASDSYFGGYVSGNECKGRVGNSELKPYYDWCEIKIPVAQSASYSVEIKGINNTSSSTKNVMTQKITNATGDIWVTLSSTALTGGKYSDLGVYTFDPDENTIGDTQRVYFAVPSGWDVGSLKITTSGVGGASTSAITSHLTRFSNYYYFDVNKSTPFITFTINDDTGASHIYKTSVQGGSKVLFNPLLDDASIEGGKGAWISFVSDQQNLKDMAVKAQSFYYGKLLIKQFDENGNSANADKSNYRYPNALRAVYTAYTTAGSSTATDDSVKTSEIMAMDDATAYSKYLDLKEWVSAYENLYNQMSVARAYIQYPVSMEFPLSATTHTEGRYSEYLHRGNDQVYTATSVANISAILKDAEELYENSGATPSALNNAAAKLSAAKESMEVEREGSIALILYDAQELLTDTSIVKVFYDGCPTGGVPVTDVNPENFPIVFVEANKTNSSGKNCIQNVYFTVNGTQEGPTQAEILDDKQFVMMDTENDPQWVENSALKYVQVQAEELMKSSGAVVFNLIDKDEDGKLDPMAVYFEKNVTVKDDGGSVLYTIKAGAYYFNPGDTALTGNALDIFSSAAQAYFTNPQNYGEISGATTSEAAGWTEGGKIKATGTYGTSAGDMNFVADSGVFSNNYVSRLYSVNNGSMYFRWDSQEQLVVGKPVIFSVKVPDKVMAKKVDPVTGKSKYVPSIVFASGGEVASNTIAPQFLFAAADPSADKMIVTFKTDTKVTYRDASGKTVSFIIYEGTYLLNKKDSSDSYIANLFDKTYWKSRMYIKSLNDTTSIINSPGGETTFSEGTYGD